MTVPQTPAAVEGVTSPGGEQSGTVYRERSPLMPPTKKTTTTKKRNVQDLTLRNKHANDKRIAALARAIRGLLNRVAALEQRERGVR